MPEQPIPPPPRPAASPLPGRSRRGPKPKPVGEKRGASVTGRLTPAELAQLDAGRGALPRGEWLRTLALARRLPRAIPEINLKAYSALARSAANLNQLARRANAADRLNITELAATLATFRAALLGVGTELEEKAKAEAQENQDDDKGKQTAGPSA